MFSHVKNSIRYYLLIAFFFLFLFFSNDFGLTDVQKTAIVTAVGIDREEDTFILTSQIAIPQSSKQSPSTKTVQLVSRGKTIGEAFEEINAKTGWYPKLVFCNLIVLGEKTVKENVFDALDYFLRDEYLSDNCYVATCDSLAKDVLDTPALVDSSSAAAISKILSNHAERVGMVLPNTLKNFSIGYFSPSKSGFLPVLKKEPQQEHVDPLSKGNGEQNSDKQGSEKGDSQKEDSKQQDSSNAKQEKNSSQEDSSSQGEGQGQGQNEQNKSDPIFSAGETALFSHGVETGRLTVEETFAVSAVLNNLRLASYTLEREGEYCSLVIKHNSPSVKLRAKKETPFTLEINLTLSAGILDYSKAQSLADVKDVGDVPKAFFTLAEKKLASDLHNAFEKSRKANCDVFGIRDRLIKYARRSLREEENLALQNTILDAKVHFRNVR